jgi:hypothetical protein
MAFDEQLGKTVLFGGGGVDDSHSLADTWLFDGSSWQEVRGHGPTGRRYASMAYDPDLRGCLMHGGSVDDAGRQGHCEAWLFRDGEWVHLPQLDTGVRDDHGLAYHHGARMLLMLEGTQGARGILARSSAGWRPVPVRKLHPRHQCSPWAWDEDLQGLVMHGGETHHGGENFDATCVLRVSTNG